MKKFVSKELEFIEKRREECGMTKTRLTMDVCKKHHYSAMLNPNNKRLPNAKHIDEFIKRLNITHEELDLYIKYGSSEESALIVEQVDKMFGLMRGNKIKELKSYMLVFEKKGSYDLIEKVEDYKNLKKILFCRAVLFFSEQKYSDIINICKDAIELTIDKFNYDNISKTINLYSYIDIECLLLVIQCLFFMGNINHCINLSEKILFHLKKQIIKDYYLISMTHYLLCIMYKNKREYKKALIHISQAINYSSTFNINNYDDFQKEYEWLNIQKNFF